MSTTLTTVLGLIKPTPGTKEPWSQAGINANWDAIDAAIGAKTTKLTTTSANNTTSETSVWSGTVPANLPQGSTWRICCWGTVDNSGTATTFTTRIKLGGTQLTAIARNTPASIQTFSGLWICGEVELMTTGAAATWRTALRDTFAQSSGTTPGLAVPGTSTTKDSTVSNLLEITVQWTAANAANIIRIDAGYFERITNG